MKLLQWGTMMDLAANMKVGLPEMHPVQLMFWEGVQDLCICVGTAHLRHHPESALMTKQVPDIPALEP